MHRLALTVAALALSFATSVSATDWPHWRGPQADGRVPDAQIDPAALQKAWTADVGVGYSAASVSDGRLYVAGWRDGQDVVQCLDAATGDEVWSHGYTIAKFDNMHKGGSGGTPVVGDGTVFYMYRDGSVVGLDAATGDQRWHVQFAKELGVDAPRWMFTGSPMPHGGAVYIDVGHILKLDAATGKPIWTSENYGAAYSTPVIFESHGRTLVAAFPVYGLVILDAESGEELTKQKWETSYGVHAATPVIDGDDIFIGSGYGTGGARFHLSDQGLSPVWETKRMRTQMSTAVLINGFLYGFDDTQLRCLSWGSGEDTWSARGLGRGSLIAVGNHLVVMSEGGELVVAEADSEAFKESRRIQLFGDKDNWVAPVYADGRLYCRSPGGELVCLSAGGS